MDKKVKNKKMDNNMTNKKTDRVTPLDSVERENVIWIAIQNERSVLKSSTLKA